MKTIKKIKPTGLYLARIDIGMQPLPTHARKMLEDAAKGLKNAFKDHGTVIVTGYEGTQKGYVTIEIIQA